MKLQEIMNGHTGEVKRVCCLYRVSTKQQVDAKKDDIPMQRVACHGFAKQQNWVIVKECYEKGVSGFKVSANDRDAIQEIREAALKKEFDVLLVYMFDRLGRRDDETPFMVEWFVKNGIEVWSTQEGQQRFDSQTDKLLNYIRYWQANGESVKTSMRLKTRMAQLTADGIYHGGVTPFGYEAVNLGRVNKKGQPVKDLQIVASEAEYVKEVFMKTMNEGYGSHRMAEYLNGKGIRTHKGAKFQPTTINRMLQNKLYCGYLTSGEVCSEKIDELAIIDEFVFENVQFILSQRKKKQDKKVKIAQHTKGAALLSGNIFCGHCGAHLVATVCTNRYICKDGTVGVARYEKYCCYHKSRKLNDCDGQSVYIRSRIDEAVLNVVETYLSKIKETPRTKALEIRYQKELDEKKKARKRVADELEKLNKQMVELSLHVGNSLCGYDEIPIEVLSMSIHSVKEKQLEKEQELAIYDKQLASQNEILSKLDFYYKQFCNWADEFDEADLERRKMIICQLIDEINVSKGYKLEIKLNASYAQFFDEEPTQARDESNA